MSTLQISTPIALQSPAASRSAPALRFLRAVVDAFAQTNRRRAEREIARVAQRYGIAAERI